jgi:hypothetical protein
MSIDDRIREELRSRGLLLKQDELARRYGVRNLDDTGIPILVVLVCRSAVVAVGDAGDFESASGDGYDGGAVRHFLRTNAVR